MEEACVQHNADKHALASERTRRTAAERATEASTNQLAATKQLLRESRAQCLAASSQLTFQVRPWPKTLSRPLDPKSCQAR